MTTTAPVPTFVCGHPRAAANIYRRKDNGQAVCVACTRERARRYRETHAPPPVLCGTCQEPLGPGQPAGYHSGACEPTTCTCPDGGHPDAIGECGSCHRLVLTHSWHGGRPG